MIKVCDSQSLIGFEKYFPTQALLQLIASSGQIPDIEMWQKIQTLAKHTEEEHQEENKMFRSLFLLNEKK